MCEGKWHNSLAAEAWKMGNLLSPGRGVKGGWDGSSEAEDGDEPKLALFRREWPVVDLGPVPGGYEDQLTSFFGGAPNSNWRQPACLPLAFEASQDRVAPPKKKTARIPIQYQVKGHVLC